VTANWSSGVREPLITVCLIRTGSPIDARIGLETDESQVEAASLVGAVAFQSATSLR
jgi:hypothetical protein